jgi:hypothetical protein
MGMIHFAKEQAQASPFSSFSHLPHYLLAVVTSAERINDQ